MHTRRDRILHNIGVIGIASTTIATGESQAPVGESGSGKSVS
jgi:ABC-type glutathione transport system ATPase component